MGDSRPKIAISRSRRCRLHRSNRLPVGRVGRPSRTLLSCSDRKRRHLRGAPGTHHSVLRSEGLVHGGCRRFGFLTVSALCAVKTASQGRIVSVRLIIEWMIGGEYRARADGEHGEDGQQVAFGPRQCLRRRPANTDIDVLRRIRARQRSELIPGATKIPENLMIPLEMRLSHRALGR